MKSYIANIEEVTLKNTDFRQVLFTSHYSQLVVMSLKPGEEIGNEIHGLDQFIRFEKGTARVILDNGKITRDVAEDWVIIIPAGTWHNVVNTGSTDLKLYTIYSPPEHRDGVVLHNKADAEEEHFDGTVS
ncbi:cupin [Candidatus Gottesmanbacteria bacterium RBG_16_52_11]|uniref:Cupin n=1 Tax=Candidatus Gottesmanbacteria bacterium RBG_16_52_11 TaxID=1798374 RepID=A0A1F5YY20_9BACT|nr:MAG: cupin [Candidatus Gottesmanbacteria bacterium RBG_16_52_11]